MALLSFTPLLVSLTMMRLLVILSLLLTGASESSVVIGIRGPGFAMIAADATFRRGIVAMDGTHDKIKQLTDSQLFAAVGDVGEADDLGEIVKQSLLLNELRSDAAMTTAMVTHFIRRHIVSERRDRGKMPKLKLLVASQDRLTWLDDTGALLDLDYAAQGIGSALVIGFLDREYHNDLTFNDALRLMQQCLRLLYARYASSTSSGFLVKVLHNDQCHIYTWRFQSSSSSSDDDDVPQQPSSSSSSSVSGPPVLIDVAPPTLAPPLAMRLTTYISQSDRRRRP